MPLDPLTGENISGLPRLTVTPNDYPLPVEQPQFDPATGLPYPTNPQPDYNGINPQLQSLFGLNGQDRYQLWPERMIRSGVSAPGDSYSGKLPVESPTGYLGSVEPSVTQMEVGPTKVPFTNLEIPSVLNALGIKNFTVPGPESEIARAQDVAGMAGMAGMSGIRMTPKNALGTSGSNLGSRLETFVDTWKDKGVRNFVTESKAIPDTLTLHDLVVPKEQRNQGIGSSYMQDLINLADEKGKKILLNAARDYGGTSVNRLKDFYKQFGFVENKGKNKDFSLSGNMYREPKLLEDTRAATGIGAINQSGFYSNLERTIANSKVQKATPDQWQAYLKNQPGVKPEELEFSLSGLGDGIITRDQLVAHVADNGIKLGEVWKGKTPEKLKGKYQEWIEKEAQNLYGQRYIDLPMSKRNTVTENVDKIYAGNPTKYSSYQLPDAEPNSYRELLLTVPEKVSNDLRYMKEIGIERELHTAKDVQDAKNYNSNFKETFKNHSDEEVLKLAEKARAISSITEPYKSSHWDEPNVLAHIRMNDREVPGVGKTLHIEEIQSDWGQAGRKHGFKDTPQYKEAMTEKEELEQQRTALIKKYNDHNNLIAARVQMTPEDRAIERNLTHKIVEFSINDHAVPNMLFKKTWDELALKRVLTEAANGPYDAVSWTPGEAQAARYDLSKQVKNITWNQSNASNSQIVRIEPHTGDKINLQLDESGKIVSSHPSSQARQFEGKHLSDVVGKEMAEKILAEREGNLSGDGLKIGGEGMKAFYDTMLPVKAAAIVKKMGGKVEYQETPKYTIDKNSVLNTEGEIVHEARTPAGAKAWIDNNQLNQKIPIIRITPQMREQIKSKGFPLYSAGVPTFTPTDDPNKPKLTPVEGNPFLTPISYDPFK